MNYDGETKHRTVIGSHVRTGSDTMFVAPVTVGDGAYTGAGSVIVKDVPAGALGVARGQQRNVEGWVERRWPDRRLPRPPPARRTEAGSGASARRRSSLAAHNALTGAIPWWRPARPPPPPTADVPTRPKEARSDEQLDPRHR